MSLEDGICPLCKRPLFAYYSYFGTHPFLDGKKYDGLCMICAELPVWAEETPTIRGIEEMCGPDSGSGYDKKEVATSMKAIKDAVAKRLKVAVKIAKWQPRPDIPDVPKVVEKTNEAGPLLPPRTVEPKTRRRATKAELPPKKYKNEPDPEPKKRGRPPKNSPPPKKYKFS